MAHFARLDSANHVVEIIVVGNNIITQPDGSESEQAGIDYCRSLFGADTNWVQCSYNNKFRVRFPALGDIYDSNLDGFIPPKPYPSWLLNTELCLWEAPIPRPNETEPWVWDEDTQSWENPPHWVAPEEPTT